MENIRFHQGDVIGASIDAIPASAIMVKNQRPHEACARVER